MCPCGEQPLLAAAIATAAATLQYQAVKGRHHLQQLGELLSRAQASLPSGAVTLHMRVLA